eukprot:snap_masked-scaffold_14-processed-gene-6.36-mRNA-1 protein AED:1.00 eAED:1.00 QI:0/0/0/0/1/1/2/0/61
MEDIQRIFGYNQRILEGIVFCSLGLNINIDHELGKYVFKVKHLDISGHESKLNENKKYIMK